MTRRLARWSWLVLTRALAPLTALLVVAILALLYAGLPKTSGTLPLAGLSKPVNVARDALGVPTIFAEDMLDAYRALGYLHAQDRLAQMEFSRRFGAGRLAEAAGPAALELDRLARTLGIKRLAEDSLKSLPPTTIAALEAYADGVNAHIRETRSRLTWAWQPEFYLLDPVPEPELWTPADSLIWSRLMGLLLGSTWRGQAARLAASEILTPEQFSFLFGRVARSADTTPWPAGALDAMRRAAIDPPTDLAPTLASNAWAISGARTASGKPLLASDPHLGYAMPGLWYLARIEVPGRSLVGATAPGVPFLILGQNGAIAWGLTTTGAATDDLIIERLSKDDPARIDTPTGSAPITSHTEVIKVRGGTDVTVMARATPHGPILSDIDPALAGLAGAGYVAAVQATALLPDDRSAEAIQRLGSAQGWEEFRAALALMGAPTQNFIYADRAGNIGLVVGGRVPLRQGGGDGLLPRQGWRGVGEWMGFIPPAEMPSFFNPAEGFVANGNGRVTAPDYPYPITPVWAPPYRGDRLRETLSTAKARDVSTEAALQMDLFEPPSRPLIAALGPARTDDPARRAAAKNLLAGWDGMMTAPATAPLIYAAWADETRRAVGAALKLPAGAADPPLDRMIAALQSANEMWCAGSCATLLDQALDRALDSLEAAYGTDHGTWRWDRAHEVRFANRIFGRIPLIGGLFESRRGVGGGNETLGRAAYFAGKNGRFEDVHGPAYRAVYDLADPSRSRFTVAPGQSGHPMSSHVADWVGIWAEGKGVPLTGSLEALTAAGATVLRLEPVAR